MRKILLILLAGISCKTSSSKISHAWGQTSFGEAALDCKEEPSPEAGYQSYIRTHLHHIASSNPEVFTGPMAASKFCVVPVVYETIDAGASVDGSLFINTGVLKATETDAQFAAVLAHELAHITRRHGAQEVDDFVALNPQYKTEFQAFQRERSRIAWPAAKSYASEAERVAYEEGFKKIVRKAWYQNQGAPSSDTPGLCFELVREASIQALRKHLHAEASAMDVESAFCQASFQDLTIGDREARLLSNAKEAEADEIGYEFYLRAGYPDDDYAQFFSNASREDARPKEDCERGDADHPRDCWRALNIREELQKHAQDIPRTRQKKALKFPVSLQELKAKY